MTRRHVYNVEKILQKKMNEDGQLVYLIKWEGYRSKANTWEPLKHLSGCLLRLEDFEQEDLRKLEDQRREEEEKIQGLHKKLNESVFFFFSGLFEQGLCLSKEEMCPLLFLHMLHVWM